MAIEKLNKGETMSCKEIMAECKFIKEINKNGITYSIYRDTTGYWIYVDRHRTKIEIVNIFYEEEVPDTDIYYEKSLKSLIFWFRVRVFKENYPELCEKFKYK